MTNKTQCPECFTVFMITDEQLIRSQGKVRCGNCRSTFNAQLMSVEVEEDKNSLRDEEISDNKRSQVVSQSDTTISPTPEQNNSWNKPQVSSLIQSPLDGNEVTRSDTNSQLPKNLETAADQQPVADSASIESSIYKKYTPNKEISKHTEISYSSEMLGRASEPVQDNPVADEPNETKALDQKSDRLFSEAMQAIDDTPNFNLDDHTGSDAIEEEFGRAQPAKPTTLNEEPSPQYKEPSANEEEPLASEEEPPASAEEPAKPDNDSFTIMSSPGEQLLADAFSVIDDTPRFNIEDYRESTLDNTELLHREAEGEHSAAQSSINKIETPVDQLLDDALSVINETPSFKVEDYSKLTVNDMESADDQAKYNTASDEGVLVPTEETTESNDDALSADVLTGVKESPSLKSADDTNIQDLQTGLFDIQNRDSNQFGELANEQISELDSPPQESDQILISEVDQLIEEKLAIDSIGADESDIMDFSKPTKNSAINRWVYAPLLALVALVLTAVLGYQLWLKQATHLLENPRLATALEPVTKPLKQQLQKYEINLPERRNLNQLELLSARTEAHPTRSSTILLRASLVNRAKISQPFPWVELSLTDEDGRLVSRRALSPSDYLHNNRIENRINANELKQVTIELLTFPKQAHGFELRLLNK